MTSNNSNIVIVASEFPPLPGGIGNHAYNLALQLSKNDYQVTVITDQRSSDEKEENDFDSTLPFEVIRTAITSPRFLMYFKRIKTIFKSIKSAQHIVATGKFSLWSVAFCSFFFNRNYIGIVHGTEVNFKAYLLRTSIDFSLNQFKTIIAVSSFTKNLISHINRPIVVIPNGFDSDKWNYNQNEQSKQLIGYPILTTVGNVTSRKGQQNVIRQLPKLIEQFPKLKYHCIGLKTEAESFLKLAKELKVESNLTFHGRINDFELQQVLTETDIFVMLSTETSTGDVEGFGIAILEANALGIPAIGAKNCGIEDAINVDISGILIDPFDTDEFMKAIKKILGDKENFCQGSKSWAKSHEWSAIINQYIPYLR